MKQRHSVSAEDTAAAGRELARDLRPGDIVALVGELGSGKTQFVTGVCDGIGAHGHVGSPTFTLIHEYPAGGTIVVHADLYRITSNAELANIGLEEYFRPPYICLIEWAERILDLLPRRHYLVTFSHGLLETERDLTIREPEESGRDAGPGN